MIVLNTLLETGLDVIAKYLALREYVFGVVFSKSCMHFPGPSL